MKKTCSHEEIYDAVSVVLQDTTSPEEICLVSIQIEGDWQKSTSLKYYTVNCFGKYEADKFQDDGYQHQISFK